MRYVILPLIKKEPLTSKKENNGFSLVEVILALATFALMITGMVGAYIYGTQTIAFGGSLSRANLLAEEGLEAARNIRDEDFQNLTPGTHGLNNDGNQWTLSGGEDQDEIFTRQLTIEDVDADRKKVTSTVNWNEGTRVNQINLETELTYWRRVVILTKNWFRVFEMSNLNISGNSVATKVANAGQYAYLVRASSTPNFVVIDISTPSEPYAINTLNLSTGINNIFILGNYAYLASSSNSAELQIVDISDPSNPKLAGTFNAPGNQNANGVYVVGNTAYLGLAGGDDFMTVDVNNPESPKLIGSLTLNGNVNDLTVSGNYAYLGTSDNSRELQIVDISNPSKPSLSSTMNLSGNDDIRSIKLIGQTLAIGRVKGSLELIDINEPTSPDLLGSYSSNGDINDISTDSSGNFLFLATNSETSEFEVIDISDKKNPSNVVTEDLDNPLNGVSYSQTQEVVIAANNDSKKEFIIFAPE